MLNLGYLFGVSKLLVRDLISFLNEKAPPGTAENWDNTGLLLGNPDWQIKNAVVGTDLTSEIVERARNLGSSAVVLHHPPLFPKSKGLNRLVPGPHANDKTKLMFEAIESHIAIIASHTNFDRSGIEVGHKIAEGLGASAVGKLSDSNERLFSLDFTVPVRSAIEVRDAVFAAGAGQIGHYSKSSFKFAGETQYLPIENSQPNAGDVGSLHIGEEIRIETVLPSSMVGPVVAALNRAHPYEEPAYRIVTIESDSHRKTGMTKGLGYGVYADFNEPISFSKLAQRVKELFNVPTFLWNGIEPVAVSRFGFTPGKGSDFCRAARNLGCQVFITGEVGYHFSQDMWRDEVAVIELGHCESELFFVDVMKEWLTEFGLSVDKVYRPFQRWHGVKTPN